MADRNAAMSFNKKPQGVMGIRTNLPGSRIARVLFCIHDGAMVLLHGFIKKTQKTPAEELDLAQRRMSGLK